ncbi:MAG: prepilin-type N-terminal cleavage/methylation domain-containing protein [Phycisphaerales bacterium]|nr:MAG: prepilin-type N-terminal cleavage/methylation domain-containing protein [Phycisphaerales bacterium]
MKRRAFTLLELSVVLVLVSILAAMALPRFINSTAGHRLNAAAVRIVADLSMAQRHARTTSTSQSIQFEPDKDGYRLPGMADIDHPGSVYYVQLFAEPYQTALVSADFGGDAEIIFDGYGKPDSGGSVVVQLRHQKKTISVDAQTGRATVGDVVWEEIPKDPKLPEPPAQID